MQAIRAKALLQIIIGPGEVRDAIAVKEAGPVTPRDLEEVGDGKGERPSGGLMPHHSAEQPLQAALQRRLCMLISVVEDVGHPMDPAIGDADVGPESGSCREALVEPGVEAPERLGHGPLFSTRSRLSEMAVRRSWSLSPEAARGGRPSSVRALRTALQ
jgi:hypothetical protein